VVLETMGRDKRVHAANSSRFDREEGVIVQ